MPGAHAPILLFFALLAHASGLNASVGSVFPIASSSSYPAAPAIFSFTTSDAEFYESFQLELLVIFLPSAIGEHRALLLNAPLEGCEDLLVEASQNFPSPLNCHSGDFRGNGTSERFLKVRFARERGLRRNASYSFVVPALELKGNGSRFDFAFLFQFRKASGELLEEAEAFLEQDVGQQLPSTKVVEFRVEGGKNLEPGGRRELRLSLQVEGFPKGGRVLVSLLPLLLWDLQTPNCTLQPLSSCEQVKVSESTGYNQLLLRPSEEVVGNLLQFEVEVLVPDVYGLFPNEPMVAVLGENGGCGPFYEASGSETPPQIEFFGRFAPAARVAHVSDRMEGSRENAVTLLVRPGAQLRGRDMKGAAREVFLQVTASAFFRIMGAATATIGAPLGTDHAPLLELSSDGRSATFFFQSHAAIALGHLEYSVQLLVENPLQHFWSISGNEPWVVAVQQGPRMGCSGCPSVRYEAEVEAPRVDFAIRGFKVLAGSMILGDASEVFFTFQLIYDAEQLLLQMPTGHKALWCGFRSPVVLDGRLRAFLACKAEGDVFRITSKPPGREMEPLPVTPLVFKGMVQYPSVNAAEGEKWSARALDAKGEVVARTREEDNVWLPLYEKQLPSFSVLPDDRTPDENAIITVGFSTSMALGPGDFIAITAPAGFKWRFLASEFSARPSGLNLAVALPVEPPSAYGKSRRLEMVVVSALASGVAYGFSARVEHPFAQPAGYWWSLETFGPGAVVLSSQRYEARTAGGYPLSQLLDIAIWPWLQARLTTSPVTVLVATTQLVLADGLLVIQSPAEFAFTSPCNTSELRLDEGPDATAETWRAADLLCEAVTPNEVQVGFSPVGLQGGLRRVFLEAGVRYALTLHSLGNPVDLDAQWNLLNRWRLLTKDAGRQVLDAAPPVEGFPVGSRLPFAEVLPGGPSTGEDLTAGMLQWVTISFQAAVPAQPRQTLAVFATPGSIFDAFCEVRDPPQHVAPFATAIGRQLSGCRGLGASAKIRIEAVWQLRRNYVFQIQIRNALPSGDEPPEVERHFRRTWRLCIDECRQMAELKRAPRPSSLNELGIAETSRVFAAEAVVLLRIRLSISMPPGGVLKVRAPLGFVFSASCEGFATVTTSKYYALPDGTACEAANTANELLLRLGSEEKHRFMAHKPYSFSVGMRNPASAAASFVWTVTTETGGGVLLDYVHTDVDEPLLGPLLRPLTGYPVRPGSPNAGDAHSLLLTFRATEEGREGEVARLELRAPVDESGVGEGNSEWDLRSPPVCFAYFKGVDGRMVEGLQHGNVTEKGGDLACLPIDGFTFSVTFRPSLLSPKRLSWLEFALENPAGSPEPHWNAWRLRLFAPLRSLEEADVANKEVGYLAAQGDLFSPQFEANLQGFPVVPSFAAIALTPGNYAVNETSEVLVEITARNAAPAGAVLVVTLPHGFKNLGDANAFAEVATVPGGLELLSSAVSEVAVKFRNGHEGGRLMFKVRLMNPTAPTTTPQLWDFQLRKAAGAELLERTMAYEGYHVYLRIDVAGLYGSVRQISSYNFVRITFALPVPLPSGGTMAVVAPSGYTLLEEGFAAEHMPPLTRMLLASEVGYNPLSINVSVPSGLHAGKYYAFRFGVENPPEQLGSDNRAWQLWALGLDGRPLAASLDVRSFKLEARFQEATLLPSSTVPLRRPNVVTMQLALSSSPLKVVRNAFQKDEALLDIRLPSPFSFAGGCYLNVGVLGPAEEASVVPFHSLQPLPASSSCELVSEKHMVIHVVETLHLGEAYHFGVELENPKEVREEGSWTVFTDRNGATLHLATEVANYALFPAARFFLSPSDIRVGASQLLQVRLLPWRHVRGASLVELTAPAAYSLSCGEVFTHHMPNGTVCAMEGNVLRLRLWPPTPYAPYTPTLLAGEAYSFAAACTNPATVPETPFELTLIEQWPTPKHVLELRADLSIPALTPPLPLLELITAEELLFNVAVPATVRFRLPAALPATQILAIVLEGPADIRISPGLSAPCVDFGAADSGKPLPESVCAGASASTILIRLQRPLPATEEPYAFKLTLPPLPWKPLVDSYVVKLQPGPAGLPLLAATAPGFAGKVADLPEWEAPVLPAALKSPVPVDSELRPGATVRRDASAGCRAGGRMLAMALLCYWLL